MICVTPYVVEERSVRFKDRVQAYGIAEAWYRYRDAALREIAVAWCEAHGIPIHRDVASASSRERWQRGRHRRVSTWQDV